MRKVIFLLGFYVLISSCSVTHTSVSNSQNNNSLQHEFVLNESTLELVEQSINSEELKEFFHFELTERLPLTLVYQKIPDDKEFTIHCFGHPVKVVKSDNDSNGSTIELIKGFESNSEMTLVFKYPIEGITITTKFSKENQKWKKKNVSIVEN